MTKDGLVIVGASGALGSCLLGSLSRDEFELFLFDKVSDPANNVHECDLIRRSSIEAAIERVSIQNSPVWRVLMTSGFYNGSLLHAPRWDDIRLSLEVNLIGVAQFVIGLVELIHSARKEARIVVVSSAAARVGSSDLGYGIAKAGVEGLVRSVSKRYCQHGISAIGVAPGIFNSPMSAYQDDQRKRAAIAATHIGRSLTLLEVARCVQFALFEAPSALTGTFISPNGGQVAV